jgi:tRNA U34 5-carboxymethylaminomethyl modifying enzyme MnmG/GidA
MKTAMQELMELNDFLKIMGVTIEWEKYLEKEKEQIVKAVNNARNTIGDDFDWNFEYDDGEEYYNQTYNQNK